jgi:hypothetical protein
MSEPALRCVDGKGAILEPMPLTIFDTKGISGNRRERIEAAVEFGGKHLTAPHEAWIATDHQGRIRVMITGPGGFQRAVTFAPDETPLYSPRWSERHRRRSEVGLPVPNAP